jgi:N-acylneuraminate cytidylyltransferase
MQPRQDDYALLKRMEVTSSSKRSVAVIPAKGYSSRVPNKNLRLFYQEQSLLEIKIKQCLQSGVFNEVYVSSDDERARAITERMGASFVLRDAKLCIDSTPWYEVLHGVLDSLPENDDVWVAWCPVTSPLFCRYAELLQSLQAKLADGINSIATVTPLRHYYLNDYYIPLNHRWGAWHTYSQKIPPIYQLNLACITAQKGEMKFCRYQIGSNPDFFPTKAWEGLDIDTQEEFELAQWYYARNFGQAHV